MTKKTVWAALVGLLAGWPALSMASDPPATLSAAEQKRLEVVQHVLADPTVSWRHLDLRYRELGADAYKTGDKPRALSMFIQASRYGDKPSQAMVAAMYWNGEGTEVDRPRAYAWMDLAADRGYQDLILQREAYWARLNEAEREQALRIGQDVYAEYSDELARKRLNLQLASQKSQPLGSHAGYVGTGIVIKSLAGLFPFAGRAGVFVDIDADPYKLSDYYSNAIWSTDDYLRIKDLQWRLKGPLQGNVDVGDPLPVSKETDTQPPA